MPSLQCVILGIDPGMHSGFALTRLWKLDSGEINPNVTLLTHDKIRGFALEKCVQTTVHGMDALSSTTNSMLTEATNLRINPATGKPVRIFIALERFVMTKNSSGGGAHASEGAGAVKGIRHLLYPNGVFLDYTQKPADKDQITDAVLRSLNLKAKGDGQQDHAHDAGRHAVLLATRVVAKGMSAIQRVCNIDEFTTRG